MQYQGGERKEQLVTAKQINLTEIEHKLLEGYRSLEKEDRLILNKVLKGLLKLDHT